MSDTSTSATRSNTLNIVKCDLLSTSKPPVSAKFFTTLFDSSYDTTISIYDKYTNRTFVQATGDREG